MIEAWKLYLTFALCIFAFDGFMICNVPCNNWNYPLGIALLGVLSLVCAVVVF